MFRSRYAALGALIALALAGCNPASSTSSGPTAGAVIPTAPATQATAPTAAAAAPLAETSAPTSPAATALPGTPLAPRGEIQSEQMTVNAAGILQPASITTTVGVTLALTLVNQSDRDALLLFDLSPAGAFGVNVPSTSIITGTPTPIAATSFPTATAAPTTTAPLLLVPTSRATGALTSTATVRGTSAPTSTLEPRGTAGPTTTITATATPAPPAGAGQMVYLRYDQAGSYAVRCAASPTDNASESTGCSGSVTIVVQEAAPAATVTPAATKTTPAITGTTTITGTPAITTTAVMTSTAATTSTSVITGTSAPATAAPASTAGTAPAATARTTAPASTAGTAPAATAGTAAPATTATP